MRLRSRLRAISAAKLMVSLVSLMFCFILRGSDILSPNGSMPLRTTFSSAAWLLVEHMID